MAYGFSPEFQRDILRVAILDPSFLFQFRQALAPDYFTEPEHVTIASTVLGLFDTIGEPADVGLTLEAYKEHLDAGLDEDEVEDEIRDLFTEGLPSGHDEITRRAVEFGRHQRLQNIIMEAPVFLEERRFDDFEEAVREAGMLSGDADAGIYDYFDRMNERFTASLQRAGETIGLGISSVDAHLGDGGLAPGEMGIFAGLPGYGKSTSLINVGANALRAGKKVFHATIGDMTSRAVGLRYDANLSGMPITKARLNYKLARDTIQGVLGENSDGLKIEFWPAYRATVMDIERKLRWLRARFAWRPDLVIVDYGANLLPRSRSLGRAAIWDRMEEIYKDLRALGAMLDTRIWTAIQANRDAWQAMRDDRPIGQENAAGSLGPMRDADVAISINMTKDERDDGVLRYHGAKVREGDAEWSEVCKVDWSRHTITPSDDFDEEDEDEDYEAPPARNDPPARRKR